MQAAKEARRGSTLPFVTASRLTSGLISDEGNNRRVGKSVLFRIVITQISLLRAVLARGGQAVLIEQTGGFLLGSRDDCFHTANDAPEAWVWRIGIALQR